MLRLWPAHHEDAILSEELLNALKEYDFCDEVWFCGQESATKPAAIHEASAEKMALMADKFRDMHPLRSANGLTFLPDYINAFMSLKVENYVDLDTHGMFICAVTEARVISDKETMTYNYYQDNVKPKPQTEGKKGWVCKVCGYVYEGDELPEDIVCPLCKHGAADFEPIG